MRDLPEAEVVIRQPGLIRPKGEDRPPEELLVLVNGEPVAKIPATKVEWWIEYADHMPRLRLTLLAGDTEVRSATGRHRTGGGT
jgi:hypothetical protein